MINCAKNLISLDKEYLSSRNPIIVENNSAYIILLGNCSTNISNPKKIAIPPDEGILLLCKPLSFGIEYDKGFFIKPNVMIAVIRNENK